MSSLLHHPSFIRNFPLPCLIARQRVSFFGPTDRSVFLVNDNWSLTAKPKGRIAKSQFPASSCKTLASFFALFESLVDPDIAYSFSVAEYHGEPPVPTARSQPTLCQSEEVPGVGKMGAAFFGEANSDP